MCSRNPRCTCEAGLERAPWHRAPHEHHARCLRWHEMQLRHAAIRDARRNARVPAPAPDPDNPTLTQALLWGLGLLVVMASLWALGMMLP